MTDLKAQKRSRVKANRRKRESQPREWKKHFQRLLRLTVLATSCSLVVCGGVLACRLLCDSGYFRVDQVRVENHRRVSQEEVLALSDIQMGTAIFDLDLEMIGRKIEENPWVAAVQVERVFPRGVVIRVAEREPKAVVNLGYLYYVDVTGEIFKTLEPKDSLDFPVVTGIDRQFLLQNSKAARSLLVDAVALIGELASRSHFNLRDVSEVHIDQAEGFNLYTYVGGIPVRMGYGNFAAKLDRLEKIYQDLEPRLLGLKSIDLNVNDRVVVKIDRGTATGRG
ncbi:MAG: cell division protein FtsQ [Desulfuromonas sp.]|uniref:cell division protein FtsQ/DivIB n=1 Tax=Desulfuromonas sp. TaxID=892 RepID=UPI000CBE3B8A|nr:FtsQ-type POTRA domain-containing protein [Desulfuromonas sp.]PLX81659.1 MAG: cell division protein FtsQ [Desulfuromonas sp.]